MQASYPAYDYFPWKDIKPFLDKKVSSYLPWDYQEKKYVNFRSETSM